MPEIELMPCHQVLTYLSYRLDEKKMENDQMKKANAKSKMKMRK